jgi:hypothetical protein
VTLASAFLSASMKTSLLPPSVARSSTSSSAAGFQVALDLRHATEALGLLAHVDHRLLGQRRQEGGERDAGGLAARHHVDLVPADVAIDRLERMAHDLGARLGIGDQLAAVDVDRARPA